MSGPTLTGVRTSPSCGADGARGSTHRMGAVPEVSPSGLGSAPAPWRREAGRTTVPKMPGALWKQMRKISWAHIPRCAVTARGEGNQPRKQHPRLKPYLLSTMHSLTNKPLPFAATRGHLRALRRPQSPAGTPCRFPGGLLSTPSPFGTAFPASAASGRGEAAASLASFKAPLPPRLRPPPLPAPQPCGSGSSPSPARSRGAAAGGREVRGAERGPPGGSMSTKAEQCEWRGRGAGQRGGAGGAARPPPAVVGIPAAARGRGVFFFFFFIIRGVPLFWLFPSHHVGEARSSRRASAPPPPPVLVATGAGLPVAAPPGAGLGAGLGALRPAAGSSGHRRRPGTPASRC